MIELVLRAGLVPEEFLQLVCRDAPSPGRAVRVQHLKEEMDERLVSLPADEVYDANLR